MRKDYFYLILIILLMLCIPLGIQIYDQSLKPGNMTPGTKEFTLTGSAQEGWILGEVQAYDIISFFKKKKKKKKTKPVLHASKGDQILIKLRSSDVTHGFSMKAYGIYLSKGIDPGQTVYVRFKADKAGTFIFKCNVFCGDVHHVMRGTLIVKE